MQLLRHLAGNCTSFSGLSVCVNKVFEWQINLYFLDAIQLDAEYFRGQNLMILSNLDLKYEVQI